MSNLVHAMQWATQLRKEILQCGNTTLTEKDIRYLDTFIDCGYMSTVASKIVEEAKYGKKKKNKMINIVGV